MTRARKILLCLTLLTAAAGVVVEHTATQRQHAQLIAQQAELARLEATVSERRRQLADLQRQQAEAERDLTTQRTALAITEAGSVIKLWANRITLLKRLLVEMPSKGIPEFRLLTPTDWVQAVRTRELDTASDIRGAFSSLGAVARKKMVTHLQEALRAYLKASDGKMPTEASQLGPYLKPPADLDMLQRYALVPKDKDGESQQMVIRESPPKEFILSVGLDTWDMSLNKDWQKSEDTDWEADIGQKLASLTTIFEGFDDLGGETAEAFLPLPAILELMKRHAPKVEEIYGDGEKFGESLKTAMRRYTAANPGESPTDMSQLAPHFDNFEKIAEAARPFFAEFKYILDHQGKAPTDPTQLERYLKAPFDPREMLRLVKIKAEDNSVTVNFNFDRSSTSKAETTTKSP